MAWGLEIVDTAGKKLGAVGLAGIRDHVYLLPDGSTARMRTRVAWCRRCEAFVAAEAIPSLEELADELARVSEYADRLITDMADPGELHESTPAKEERYREELMAEQSAHLSALMRWRRLRQSQPKCLDCGSAELIAVKESAGDGIHPITGEKIELLMAYHALMPVQMYAVEGDLIEETGDRKR